jgi:LemA protein
MSCAILERYPNEDKMRSSAMAKKTNYWLWGILGIITFSFIWIFSTKNRLVTLNESIDASWAQVENQLQRRYDLIPNLVNTVKGFANQEKEIFENIANARSRLAGAKSVSEKIEASTQVESALSRLLVVVENYPNLKSDQQFTKLMDELSGAENRISVERMRYNENVKIYNLAIKHIPASYVASVFGYAQKPYFQIQDTAKQAPVVDFGK